MALLGDIVDGLVENLAKQGEMLPDKNASLFWGNVRKDIQRTRHTSYMEEKKNAQIARRQKELAEVSTQNSNSESSFSNTAGKAALAGAVIAGGAFLLKKFLDDSGSDNLGIDVKKD